MMSTLLLMLLCLPHTVSVSRVPPAPENLRVKSVNLKHVLQWERGAGTSAEVTYRVSFHTERGPCCTVVPGCERVQEPLRCDFTDAFSDQEETYYLWVTAQHHSEQSSTSGGPFHPIRDTELQPPDLQVALCNSSLCVDMDTPGPDALLHSLYMSFWYELKVESSAMQKPKLLPFRSLSRQLISDVRVGSQYCVSIRFADRIIPRQSSFGPTQCVLPSPTHISTVLLLLPGLLVLLLLLLLLAVFYTVSVYHGKAALPLVLTSVLQSEETLEVSCHPAVFSLLLIEPEPSEDQTEHCSSETDGSEMEQDCKEAGGSAHATHYTSKASLCSQHTSSQSSVHMEEPEEVGLLKEEPEEVDLLMEGSEEVDLLMEGSEEVGLLMEGSEEVGLLMEGPEEVDLLMEGSEEVDLLMEGPEEVDLLTLTFSRDTEKETGAADLLCEVELPLCELIEEQAEHQEDSEDECFGTGYMSRS